MGLIDAVGEGPVAIDTSIFVYFIERRSLYLPVLMPLFAKIDDGELPAVTSDLTLLEALVIPYRAGDRAVAEEYEAILTSGRGLTLVPIDLSIIRLAARIRAATAVRTPDALHLATAVVTNCRAFLTNDRRLRSIRGLEVLQLDAFVPPTT